MDDRDRNDLFFRDLFELDNTDAAGAPFFASGLDSGIADRTKPTETENASNRETERDTDGQSRFSGERMVDKRPMATLIQPGTACTKHNA